LTLKMLLQNYREAVTTQSPGLLQPWGTDVDMKSTLKGLHPVSRNPFRVETRFIPGPGVEATPGFETQPLRGCRARMPVARFGCIAIALLLVASSVMSQTPTRTPADTVREFYKLLREKKFREAFNMSIYRPAVEGLSQQEFDDLRVDFEKMSIAVTERIPGNIDVTGEQISGEIATVFVKVLDPEGKDKIEPASLLKIGNDWVVGDKESFDMVKKAGKQFFFEARITAHHNDVQDLMTRITLAQVVYSQGHNGQFGNMAELIAAGLIPKDIETPDSTGYKFNVIRSADGKLWHATAEPAQYGRSGRLSFYLDASGVKNGDNGGKPLILKP
jgi:hypothetical protein